MGEETRIKFHRLILVILVAFTVSAIPVADDHDIMVSDRCQLHEAIKSANWDSAIGGCSAGDGIDRIILSADITLSANLPEITDRVSITGNGHSISGANRFRHFAVGENTTLWLNNVVLKDGHNSYSASIYNSGQLVIQDSLIRDNGDGENFGVILGFGDLVIRNSTIQGNRARRNAVIKGTQEIRIENSTISSNSGAAVEGGRDVWIEDSVISGNGSADTYESAVTVSEGHLNLDDSVVSDNQGGGITIRGASAFISNSSINGNQNRRNGGGIRSTDTRFAEIKNSTISGNRADDAGGGIYVSGESDITLQHVTIADNSAERGGGIYRREGSVKLLNSIIAGSQPQDCRGILAQNVGSLIEDGTCLPAQSGDPLLGPLTGFPAYHPLDDGSPALNNADDEHCLDSDQIGAERPAPAGGGCDIGAIESAAGAAGAAPTPEPEVCTLTDAIRAANADEAVGGCPAGDGHDTISLSAFDFEYNTFWLESELPAITSEITIEGEDGLISGQDEHRIFVVDGGNLTIKQLKMVSGYAVKGGAIHVTGGGSQHLVDSSVCHNKAEEDGGGIYADSNSVVHLTDTTVCDNESIDNGYGGGIYLDEGATLEAQDSNFLDNSGAKYGGAVYADAASVSITHSGFSGNSANISGGATFASDSSTITISGSVFVRNITSFTGGAIDVNDTNLTISNTTISGNRAEGSSIEFSSYGGGISASNSEVTLTHVTIARNFANWTGGLRVSSSQNEPTLRLQNSILADNIGDDCTIEENVIVAVDSGNLIQDGSCPAELQGNPRLDALRGLREHHPLLPDSPAIDAADAEYCTPLDQLGRARPQGGGCDIGALESAFTAQAPPTPTVCTLADRIIAANRDAPYGACPAGDGADAILLSEDIVLSEALPPITSAITIEGQGHSISGANAFRIFTVRRGGKLAVNNLTLRDGDAWLGGAILVDDDGELIVSNSEFADNAAVGGGAIAKTREASLFIRDSRFRGNRASESGGALRSSGTDSEATIERSAFIDNHAGERGGAIDSFLNNMKIVNTTISGNSATYGGGINAWGLLEGYVPVVLQHVTISENQALEGAAINTGADVVLLNSIVTGSISVDSCHDIGAAGANIAEDHDCLLVITGDPLLGDRAGGNYHPLRAGSPAIDAANVGDCPPIDQLGNPRPQGDGCDLGAIEYMGE